MAARRGAVAQVLADRLAAVLTTPQDQGHPALHIDSSDAAALLLGPLYCRSTIEHAPAEEPLLDAALASIGHWTHGS